MPPRPTTTQRLLFEAIDDPRAAPPPQLPKEVRAQLQQQLVQWMQAVALAMDGKGNRDEQDHR